MILLAALLCTPCHSAIVESYRQSPMARSSGPVEALAPAVYTHARSRTKYTIESPNRVVIQTPEQRATQQLHYFIGSGAHGRSFLFLRGAGLFQAPVTQYAGRGWAMSPGYEEDQFSDWTRPIDRNCLWCHASSQRPIYGTRNQYANPPFAENGITCERCHGDAKQHVADPRRRPVNPAKLAPALRDDVCRQCHTIGKTRADKPGRSFFEYRPGMALSALVTYETVPQTRDMDLKVTGHFERLAMSKCRIATGDKLWCGTCHNPHPTAAVDKNQACRTCHTPPKCARGPDCQSCHMPKAPSPEANHATFTDHWIR